ncbi:Signal recognition particle subunit SRP54 [Colletotrichum fructicola]|nr:Signal recognition particle subunit SRP54 [Colletotrichum fructicola]KAF4901828.1 Signal recognition particle subunit SRP54 [Colletotrichum fructicola]KAF4939973.1 Signal recognition particle subunit SRP54 [Colletotrichum fructicola]
MSRTLLLCFIHGFKGNDDTFREFPDDLKRVVTKQLPDHRVESIVYPKYETKGELAEATEAFLAWSWKGFVAADALFLAVNERAHANPSEDDPIFPPIQGILTFDTPYNGLARSMFVYGAFSNYQKVSSVFNVMTALSAAAPASLARLGTRRAATSAVASTARNPGWKTWQLVAVRTGTVGAIAAGGVAAYVNREAIMNGLKNLNKESVKEGYRQSIDALGQGLAYINRGNVGRSFAWLSDHFTFVGALLKQKELNRRLERMGALKGVGIHDFYASLGENGYWQGGYFVPERTFCAVPEESHAAYPLFSRQVLRKVDDEVQAHMSLFDPEKNEDYEKMTDKAADLVIEWFNSEERVVDDPKFREPPPEEAQEDHEVEETLEKAKSNEEAEKSDEKLDVKEASKSTDELPDESPIDIAAAASVVPLSEDGDGDLVGDASPENVDTEQKRTYMQHLFQVAQQTGTGVRGLWPSKMPNMPNMPNMPSMPGMPGMPGMPSMPKVPTSVSSLGQVSMPSVNIWRRGTPSQAQDGKDAAEKTGEAPKSDEATKSGEAVESKTGEAKIEDSKAEEAKAEESKAADTTVDTEKPKDESGVQPGSEPKEVGSTVEKKE